MNWRFRVAATALVAMFSAVPLAAQNPGDTALNKAYQDLQQKDYDSAIADFRAGLEKQPDNAAAHKDLAYTLLKTGENAEARDEFEQALKINPKDETAALEFAFLAFETKKPIEAREMFDKLRHSANPQTRATAQRAFDNIDQPLADGIARWQQAIARSDKPNDVTMFSAHWELAQLAELRDDLPLAAQQFEICHEIKPQLNEILLILARVWTKLNRVDEAHAALLAASRSSDSRTAEQALELMGNMQQRYPYPYEFLAALKLDPNNLKLRKELAYLYIAMHRDGDAIDQFERVLALSPNDQAVKDQLDELKGMKKEAAATDAPVQPASPFAAPSPARSGAEDELNAKEMGMKSYTLGYSNDAIKYLTRAHQLDENDMEVTLKLAWALNQAHRDEDALTYFNIARKAKDPRIAKEADKAYHVLQGDVTPQTTTWLLPMYSSRWNDLFTYGQIKRSLPIPGLTALNKRFTFYVSARFEGDVKSTDAPHAITAQYYSGSEVIFGLGAATTTWHHLTGWVEAGEAINYLPWRKDIGLATPDYRGGLNFAKGFGSLLGSEKPGIFYETTGDAIYLSRFDRDWLFYWQNRTGYTLHFRDAKLQFLLNGNLVRDVKQQYWANTFEFGPGLRLHPAWLPQNLFFSADLLRGAYLTPYYWPHRPNYYDVRLGFWFAKTTK